MEEHQQADTRPDAATVRVGKATIGPDAFCLIAAVPLGAPAERAVEAAGAARAAGAQLLLGRVRRHGRAAAAAALALLAECQDATGLPGVVEVPQADLAGAAAASADMLLVRGGGIDEPGLLDAGGGSGLPCLLERTPGAGVGSGLAAAAALDAAGARGVGLCAPAAGSSPPSWPPAGGLDLSAVPVLRERSGLPVVVDPSALRASAATVAALARAAAAVGADGLVIDAPRSAADLADARTALDGTDLASLISDVHAVAAVTGRRPTPSRIRYVTAR
jgi:3-deoxy-7-phosphoheptulonate synthase